MKFDMQTITSYQNAALTEMVRKSAAKSAGQQRYAAVRRFKDFLAQLSLPARLASRAKWYSAPPDSGAGRAGVWLGRRRVRRENGKPFFQPVWC
ncbi:hypothetical protein ACNKHO_06955 [Shigella flexneri]